MLACGQYRNNIIPEPPFRINCIPKGSFCNSHWEQKEVAKMAVVPPRDPAAGPRILVCDPIHEEGLRLLRQHARVDVVEGALTPAELAERIGDYEAVIVGARTTLPAAVIHRGSRLQVIGRAAAGLDNIDVAAARAEGVQVVDSPDPHTVAVAEQVLALMLALAHRLHPGRGGSPGATGLSSLDAPAGLAGKTLGVLGFGPVGRQVAGRARAFGMRVLVHQQPPTPELILDPAVEQVSLTDLLEQADVLTIHDLSGPLTGSLDASTLARLPTGAIVVLAVPQARVDAEVLLEGLETGRLAGVGLVLAEEPPRTWSGLLSHPRVLVAPPLPPHPAETQRRLALAVAHQVLARLRPQPPAGTLALKVVAVEEALPHEEYDRSRVTELAARLTAEGRLINPPVAVLHRGRYIVLDGATRVTAFRELRYPHIVLQVVDLGQQGVQLYTWHHVIRGGAGLLSRLAELPGIRLVPVGEGGDGPDAGEQALAHLITAQGVTYRVEAAAGADWLEQLNQVVACYSEWGRVERTLTTDLESLRSQYPDLAALVTFPPFTLDTVLTLAAEGRKLPAGITRFVIPGRILRLNAPLERLAGDEPLAAKQAWLDNLLREKLAYRQVRYYQEPVVLLDE